MTVREIEVLSRGPAAFRRSRVSGVCATVFISVALGFLLPTPAAHAQDAKVEVNITAQPLSGALLQLGRQTHLQLLFPSTLVSQVQVTGVQGRLTPEEALRRLLVGTDIQYERNGNTITLSRSVPVTEIQPVTVVGDGGGLGGYVAQTSNMAGLNIPLIETPRSISVVTQEQLKTQAPRSIGQALSYTSGVLTENAGGGDIRMSGAIIRGFSDGSAYFKDGLKQLSAGSYGSWNDPINELESIEVLKGPASVFFGQSRPGGVINVVSKRPTIDQVNSIGASYGTYARREITADVGGAFDDNNTVLYRLNVLGRESNARTVDAQDDRFSIAPSLLWNISDKTRITLLGQYSRERGTPKTWWPSLFVYPEIAQLPASRTAGDPSFDRFDRDTKSIGYAAEHETQNGWRLRQNLRYSEIDIDYAHIYAYSVQADGRTVSRGSLAQITNGKTLAVDTRAERDFQWGSLRHTFSAGLDYMKYKERDGLGFGDAPSLDMYRPVYQSNIARPALDQSSSNMEQTGVYTINQFKLYRWVANLSLRQDAVRTSQTSKTQPRTSDDATTGSAGLLYLFDSGFAPYVSYATAFDPVIGKQFDGTPFLPRKGEQYELGLKYQAPGTQSLITASVFDIRQTNVTTMDPDHPNFNVQTGEVRSRGFELEGKFKLSHELAVLANYTYVDPEIIKSNKPAEIGRQVGQTVKHAASLWLDYRPGTVPGLMVAGGARYRGKAYFQAGANGQDFYDRPFTVYDAAIAYETPQYRVALNVNNVFDKKYFTSTFRGASREAMLSLNYFW